MRRCLKYKKVSPKNCHFQRKGNENQYKHSAEVISNVKEARSILGNSDMNTQKVVAANERKYLNVSVLYVQERQMMIKLERLARFRLEIRTRVPMQSHKLRRRESDESCIVKS